MCVHSHSYIPMFTDNMIHRKIFCRLKIIALCEYQITNIIGFNI